MTERQKQIDIEVETHRAKASNLRATAALVESLIAEEESAIELLSGERDLCALNEAEGVIE